ncbi:hypothetical protein [Campylobacter upsaliensis]|uniref:hypothetical protein n=1 Tax=Campylobacter upsaliensis TaxID=28080 RepID=UPI002149AFB4|nr:hypothetical protein [Campylobacter upsaliensis]MCR2118812.1 hypothetical protein [Campylobacter upsaliensis]
MDLSEFTKKRSYSCVLSGKNLVFSYTGKSRFVLKDAVFLERLCLDVLEKYNIKMLIFLSFHTQRFVLRLRLICK